MVGTTTDPWRDLSKLRCQSGYFAVPGPVRPVLRLFHSRARLTKQPAPDRSICDGVSVFLEQQTAQRVLGSLIVFPA